MITPTKCRLAAFHRPAFTNMCFTACSRRAISNRSGFRLRVVRNAALSLLGGHIDVAIMTPSSALAQIKNGDIRLLGISSAERNEYFPNVPTFKEQGYDVVASIWRSVMVKAGTPKDIIDTLMLRDSENAEIKGMARLLSLKHAVVGEHLAR